MSKQGTWADNVIIQGVADALNHFKITGYPCNLIGSQWWDLIPNRTIFCSKSHLFLCQ